MASANETLGSGAARPLPVRMRPDLAAREQRYQGKRYWAVKDPVGLHYFRFEEEEYALLTMLDGSASLQTLKERFEQRFAPQKISLEELQRLVGMLHRNCLVIADAGGQGEQLLLRGDKTRRAQRAAAWTNFLAIRFRGFDPQRLLDVLYPRVRWMFTLPAMTAACGLIVLALLLVLVHLDTFYARLPAVEEFFALQNWFWLALVLVVTKALHELGHGLACRHYGGECHEMGVMLLVFTPCLYCNVSDAWMLPSKWQRAAIGAAGMYVELVVAAIATFLWWFSAPGLLNYLALNTMFIASVSTLLFNGNPLLRYDGYYILADLVEIPNLRQKAGSLLHRQLGWWCLGLRPPHDPFLPQRRPWLLAAYAVAAAVYRWVITLAILWFLYKVFQPYRLEILSQLLTLAAMYALAVRPLWQVVKFFHVPGRAQKVNPRRMYATVGCLALAAAAVLLVPVPSPVYCPLELRPRDAASIYVDVPGRLQEIYVSPGQRVEAGEVLGRLSSIDVRLAIARLTGERDHYQARLDSLRQQRFRDEQAALEIAQVHESLTHIQQQLEQKQRDMKALELTAPVAGCVIPPPSVPMEEDNQIELVSWSGTPLESRNLGATLGESTLFCQIGDPRRLEAILVIDQGDIERVGEGQRVEILLDQSPGRVLRSEIAEMARSDLKLSSARLSSKSGGSLATRTDASGLEKPLSTSYEALVPLDDEDATLRPGLRGTAKIHAPWQTLGSRLWRYLARTFHFEL